MEWKKCYVVVVESVIKGVAEKDWCDMMANTVSQLFIVCGTLLYNYTARYVIIQVVSSICRIDNFQVTFRVVFTI